MMTQKKQFILAQIFGPDTSFINVVFGVGPIGLSQIIIVLRGYNGYAKEFVIFLNTKRAYWKTGAACINCSAHILDDGWRFPMVCDSVSDEGLHLKAIGVGFELARTKYENIWPLQFREGILCRLSGLLSRLCGGIRDGKRIFHVTGLLGGGIKQPHSEGGQNAVEKNEQPIGGMIKKSIVPVAFLISFLSLIGPVRAGGRMAVLAFGFGWLRLIVYYGLL
ncbi:MAG: hypothetical protein ABSC37_07645 [Xanthobacteraceae bacterium]